MAVHAQWPANLVAQNIVEVSSTEQIFDTTVFGYSLLYNHLAIGRWVMAIIHVATSPRRDGATDGHNPTGVNMDIHRGPCWSVTF